MRHDSATGAPPPYACPDCHGALNTVPDDTVPRREPDPRWPPTTVTGP